MSHRSETVRDLSLQDLRAHPEIVTDLLSQSDEMSILLRRSGNTVRLAATRAYSKEAVRVVAKARAEYAKKKADGYSREDAIADFESFQDGLAHHTG